MQGRDLLRDPKQRMRLIQSLKENRDGDTYPFHMPGHKRRLAGDELFGKVYGIDITEIEGFDDLYHADGILKEAQERAASLFGSDETRFLVNGSTGGILAAICSQVTSGDAVFVAGNCHRSVYNAAMLSGAALYVIAPEREELFDICAGIDAGSVEEALDKAGNSGHRTAVVITSPTYEGVTSDIRAIAGVCRKKGSVLIVDAAHGAHFGFSDHFPESAVSQGADIVITSVHKTLPAMTQTALIHIRKDCPAKDRLYRMLPVFMTSSPSYVLMASIDDMTHLLEERGRQLFDAYEARLDDLYRKAKDFANIMLLKKELLTAKGSADHDKGRIVIRDVTGKYSGKKLSEILSKQYGMIAEMAAEDHVVLITSVADTDEGFARLFDALKDIDRMIGEDTVPVAGQRGENSIRILRHQEGIDMKAALFCERTQNISVEHAEGRTAADTVTVYPPGIPVVIPGEVITSDAIETIIEAVKSGLRITGLKDKEITVTWERSST